MKSIFAKVLFIIGIIVIFLLLVFAVIKFVPVAFSSLANVGSSIANGFKSSTGTELELSINDSDLNTDEEFVISWENSIKEDGEYAITYPCIDDFKLWIINSDSQNMLICNSPYTISDDTDSVTLRPTLEKADSFVDVPVTISYTIDGDTNPEAEESVTVTIKNSEGSVLGTTNDESGNEVTTEPDIEYVDEDSNTSSNSGSTNNSNTTSGNSSSNSSTSNTSSNTSSNNTVVGTTYTGLADLAISNVTALSGQSGLQFTVRNLGGQTIAGWYFSYTTPTIPTQTLTSSIQQALRPGEGLRVTIRYNEQNTAVANVSIFVDPTNLIAEKNEFNNTTVVSVFTQNPTNPSNPTFPPTGGNFDDADLEIRNLEVGELSGNRFRENDELRDGDDLAVRFEVTNRGDQYTGTWYFDVDGLPYDRRDDRYTSNRQPSLAPGATQEIIIEFTNVEEGSYDINVDIDSNDDVREDDERNNDDSVSLRVRN